MWDDEDHSLFCVYSPHACLTMQSSVQAHSECMGYNEESFTTNLKGTELLLSFYSYLTENNLHFR